MTGADARLRAIAGDLLASSRLSDAQVADRVALARSPDYWRRIAPQSSVGASPPALEPSRLPASALAVVCRHFTDEGYFQMPTVLSSSALSRLNDIVDAVVGQGWPPVFVWLYDEFWMLARAPELGALLTFVLGGGYVQLPYVWVNLIPAAVGASGWPPHFDSDAAGRISIWIALTDATYTNGCIHIVPRMSVAEDFRTQPVATGRVRLADAMRALHASRALPAPAGSMLGWGGDILHWGGSCTEAGAARRSVSMEFVTQAGAPPPDRMPLMPMAGPLPSFADRLRSVAACMLAYEGHEPVITRYRGIAERLGR